MAIPEEYGRFVNKVIELTVQKKIPWESVGDNRTFIASFVSDTIRIFAGYDHGTERPYISFALLGSDGEFLDGFSLETGDSDYDRMSDLHAMARRQVQGVEERIKRIESKLKDYE